MKQLSMLYFCVFFSICAHAQESKSAPELTEIWAPVPKIISPGKSAADPPSDAVVLYGSMEDTANWAGKDGQDFTWKPEDDFFTVVPNAGDLRTKRAFGDCQLHIEWSTPAEVSGSGQGRGNSGIFLMSRYELQVLDSYNNTTYSNGQAGSIYKQHMPLVNVCRPPGAWQTYDIIFKAPQFNADGFPKSPARITVLQNGVLIQNNVELWGSMQFIGVPKYEQHTDKEPLLLQDHHNPVRYRNIWVREL